MREEAQVLIERQFLAGGRETVAAEANGAVGRSGCRGSKAPDAQQVLHAHDEFLLAKRFADIVVAARFETLQHVLCLVFGGQENDRNVRVEPADVLPQRKTVAVRQHHIQYTDVGAELFESGQHLPAVGHQQHLKLATFEAFAHDFA